MRSFLRFSAQNLGKRRKEERIKHHINQHQHQANGFDRSHLKYLLFHNLAYHHLQHFTRPPVLPWVVPIVSTLLPRFGGAEPGRKSLAKHRRHSATFQQNFWEFPCTAYEKVEMLFQLFESAYSSPAPPLDGCQPKLLHVAATPPGFRNTAGFPKFLSFISVSPCVSTHLEFLCLSRIKNRQHVSPRWPWDLLSPYGSLPHSHDVLGCDHYRSHCASGGQSNHL